MRCSASQAFKDLAGLPEGVLCTMFTCVHDIAIVPKPVVTRHCGFSGGEPTITALPSNPARSHIRYGMRSAQVRPNSHAMLLCSVLTLLQAQVLPQSHTELR